MYTDSQVFLGMGVNGQTVDTRPPSLFPRSLGMRLEIHYLKYVILLSEYTIHLMNISLKSIVNITLRRSCCPL